MELRLAHHKEPATYLTSDYAHQSISRPVSHDLNKKAHSRAHKQYPLPSLSLNTLTANDDQKIRGQLNELLNNRPLPRELILTLLMNYETPLAMEKLLLNNPRLACRLFELAIKEDHKIIAANILMAVLASYQKTTDKQKIEKAFFDFVLAQFSYQYFSSDLFCQLLIEHASQEQLQTLIDLLKSYGLHKKLHRLTQRYLLDYHLINNLELLVFGFERKIKKNNGTRTTENVVMSTIMKYLQNDILILNNVNTLINAALVKKNLPFAHMLANYIMQHGELTHKNKVKLAISSHLCPKTSHSNQRHHFIVETANELKQWLELVDISDVAPATEQWENLLCKALQQNNHSIYRPLLNHSKCIVKLAAKEQTIYTILSAALKCSQHSAPLESLLNTSHYEKALASVLAETAYGPLQPNECPPIDQRISNMINACIQGSRQHTQYTICLKKLVLLNTWFSALDNDDVKKHWMEYMDHGSFVSQQRIENLPLLIEIFLWAKRDINIKQVSWHRAIIDLINPPIMNNTLRHSLFSHSKIIIMVISNLEKDNQLYQQWQFFAAGQIEGLAHLMMSVIHGLYYCHSDKIKLKKVLWGLLETIEKHKVMDAVCENLINSCVWEYKPDLSMKLNQDIGLDDDIILLNPDHLLEVTYGDSPAQEMHNALKTLIHRTSPETTNEKPQETEENSNESQTSMDHTLSDKEEEKTTKTHSLTLKNEHAIAIHTANESENTLSPINNSRLSNVKKLFVNFLLSKFRWLFSLLKLPRPF